MNRIVLGAVGALVFVGAGLFWWQGRAQVETGAPPPDLVAELARDKAGDSDPDSLPQADVTGLKGPAPPEATELTKEQQRFYRYDRNRDQRITRTEMMASRAAAFRKLDTDGNNLLTFEEWAVATSEKFHKADANGDLWLSPAEFASTKPKPKPKPKCKC